MIARRWAVALMLVGAPAEAGIVLEGVHWQAGPAETVRAGAWRDVKVLRNNPPRLESGLRARLVLSNDGPTPEEGLLIRYSMTARVSPIAGAPAAGAWAIPFVVDEKRVPVVAPDSMIDVVLETGTALRLYVRRLARAGWWPDQVKLQVMLEPRPGEDGLQAVEGGLDIQRGQGR